MARPYSNDFRERVVAAVAAGRSCREVAGLFEVSVASVVKRLQRHRMALSFGSYRSWSAGDRRRDGFAGKLVLSPIKDAVDLT